ncbi:hypothetical protein CHUAL_001714 [Chamberlinius hualienensis]
MAVSVALSIAIAAGSSVLTYKLIPNFKEMFIKAGLSGVDMSKKKKDIIPESMGAIVASVYLMAMFFFIPVPFSKYFKSTNGFPHGEFVELIAALLSICCMVLLGFADDVLDLRWRHKLLLPTMASLPLLMVYFVNCNSTIIIVPRPVRFLLGFDIDLGFLYYVYMGMLAVFCTNAINILAGINGLEVGQSILIALSVILFNCIEIWLGNGIKFHQFSLYILIPYIGTTMPLLYYNWYPSSVFVGDTFCYFSGMLFAVVGILGHFSKTVLLFFIPQILNFLYSVPQVFRFVPCPRHRLPRYDSKTDLMFISVSHFKMTELHPLGALILRIFRKLHLVSFVENIGEKGQYAECNNMTLINFILLFTGPTHERRLTTYLMVFQVMCTCVALIIRYPLAKIFYD